MRWCSSVSYTHLDVYKRQQLARTQADFVLLSENLDHLRRGMLRGKKTLRVIRQNLWWSFAYNFVALPLAIAGFVTPWMAGIGMSASSLLVVLNSLRIQRLDKDVYKRQPLECSDKKGKRYCEKVAGITVFVNGECTA